MRKQTEVKATGMYTEKHNILSRVFSVRKMDGRKVVTLFDIKIRLRRSKWQLIKTKLEQIEQTNKAILKRQQLFFDKTYNLVLLSCFPGKTPQEASQEIYTSYPKATGFLAEIQQCNLALMKELQKACELLHIQFWLHAGTLIGAIRHQGFIPWDDDVDVAMTRADFQKFRSHLPDFPQLLLEEYYNQYTCSRQYQLKFSNGLPVFIDIVQYDTCNAVTPEEKATFLRSYRDAYSYLLYRFNKELGQPKIIDVGYYGVGKLDEQNKKRVDEIIDQATASLHPTQLLEKPSFYYALENYPFAYPVMKYEELFPLIPMQFEDSTFLTPANPILYLQPYGNIWAPPADINKNPHTYAFESKKGLIEEFLHDYQSK